MKPMQVREKTPKTKNQKPKTKNQKPKTKNQKQPQKIFFLLSPLIKPECR